MPRLELDLTQPVDDSSNSTGWSSQRSNPNLRNRIAHQPEILPSPQQETQSTTTDDGDEYFDAEIYSHISLPSTANPHSEIRRWVDELDEPHGCLMFIDNGVSAKMIFCYWNALVSSRLIGSPQGDLLQSWLYIWVYTSLIFMTESVLDIGRKIASSGKVAPSDLLIILSCILEWVTWELDTRDFERTVTVEYVLQYIGLACSGLSCHCNLQTYTAALSKYLNIQGSLLIKMWYTVEFFYCVVYVSLCINALFSIDSTIEDHKPLIIMIEASPLLLISMYVCIAVNLISHYMARKITAEKEIWTYPSTYTGVIVRRVYVILLPTLNAICINFIFVTASLISIKFRHHRLLFCLQ